jgi:hypothetical protein
MLKGKRKLGEQKSASRAGEMNIVLLHCSSNINPRLKGRHNGVVTLSEGSAVATALPIGRTLLGATPCKPVDVH